MNRMTEPYLKKIDLEGKYVRLLPLVVTRDAGALFTLSNGSPITLGNRSYPKYNSDELIWRYMFEGPFASLHDFEAYLQTAVQTTNALCLTVFDSTTGLPIGVTNFINNAPSHLKIELGGIWYSPIAQRTPANTEATYLMLKHAFQLGYRRLEWKCHSENVRSRNAARRLGFTFEGIQEWHMICKGKSRDTAWYRILSPEWPIVKHHLESLLYATK